MMEFPVPVFLTMFHLARAVHDDELRQHAIRDVCADDASSERAVHAHGYVFLLAFRQTCKNAIRFAHANHTKCEYVVWVCLCLQKHFAWRICLP